MIDTDPNSNEAFRCVHDVDYVEPDERYSCGDCPAFAIALHRLTGRPLAALLDEDGGQVVLVHAFVLLDNEGEVLDAAGEKTVEYVMNEFPHSGSPWLEEISEEKLIKIGYENGLPADMVKIMDDARCVADDYSLKRLPAKSKTMRP